MMNEQQLKEMRSVDIATIDKSTLVDITSFQINEDAPHNDRVCEFVRQAKNPYAFRVGDVAVKLEFDRNGKTLQEAILSYLRTVHKQ